MKRHLVLALMTSAFLAPAFASDPSSITPAKDANGRTVFVNDETSPKPAAAGSSASAQAQDWPHRTVSYMYYSREKRRWIKVGSATVAGQRARSAAKEVATDIAGSGTPADPASIKGNRARMTDAQVDAAIDEAAARHNVDPSLVRAVVKVESNFNPHAVSRKGAVGLMQLMPSTARQLRVTDPYDPQQNIDGGVRHLKQLLENFNGNVPLSLAAYNAGEGAVNRSNGIPQYKETQNYVKQITELYWNGTSETGRRWFAPTYRSAPIRMSKDAQGHLSFSNTE
jgi:soluble lytic murein transglycosylase-like protein